MPGRVWLISGSAIVLLAGVAFLRSIAPSDSSPIVPEGSAIVTEGEREESASRPAADGRLLYVGAPGVGSRLEYGGAGVLVFDIDDGHRFVKRISFAEGSGGGVEPVRGIAAHAQSARLYISTTRRMIAIDLLTVRSCGRAMLEAAAAIGWRSHPTASSCTCRRSGCRVGTSLTRGTAD